MAERVLSVEIGYSLTKVCEIERNGKTPRILGSFVIETPEGMLKDGAIEVSNDFVTLFNEMMDSHKIKTRKAVFTIASSRIATREAIIPYVKEKQITDVVRANLADYFPVDPSTYMFSHSIIGVVRDNSNALPKNDSEEEGAKKETKESLGRPTGYKILVLAVPKPIIISYENLAKALGLEITTIDYNGNSIYQAAKEECKDGVQLIVKIDERSALLMVMEDGVIALNRTIPYGIDEALTVLSTTKHLGPASTYPEALELVRRKTVILNNFQGASMATEDTTDSQAEIIRTEKRAVTDSLHSLAGGILRVIDFYNSNHSSRPIQSALITGIGADFSGIGALLSNELDIKVRNLTHLAGIDIEKVFKDVTYGEYVTVIGATMAPVSFYADHDEVKKAGNGKGGSSSNISADSPAGTAIAFGVLVVGIIAAAVLFVLSYFPYLDAKKTNEGYKKTIESLQPAYDKYLEYKQSEQQVLYARGIEKAATNTLSQLPDFILKMQSDLPYDICFNSLEADTEKVTFEAMVLSKDEVVAALDKLQSYEMFSSVELEGVKYEENDLGEMVYTFTVNLYFASLDPVDEEVEEDA